MLFSSTVFVFAFLPAVLAAFLWLQGRELVRASFALLVLASLFFYAWWRPDYLPILAGSILFNYVWGRLLGRSRASGAGRALLAVGVVANLALLGWFKYAGFFAETIDAVFGAGWHVEAVLLPLGISFFTFQQIAYLVDTHRDATRRTGLLDYALFVAFFPQLIAGPIVHHREMLGQFAARRPRARVAPEVLLGLSIFAVGLFKKSVLADGVAPYSDTVFALAGAGTTLDLLYAWSGALAYTLQLYFDFSGYSDMAIGLGLLFGIRLPLNFDSPYRSTGIIEFWRRWHMTLSRFLRDYLYFPLGGGRGGTFSRYRNLMLVMLLGGLWHGAGWTFVLWGGLHGTYLLVNHAWRASVAGAGRAPRVPAALARTLSIALTFVAVVVAWVFFRAEDAGTAWRVIAAMGGANGVGLPAGLAAAVPAPLGSLAGLHVNELPGLGPPFAPFHDVALLLGGAGSAERVGSLTVLATLVPLLGIVFLAPNTQRVFGYRPAGTPDGELASGPAGPLADRSGARAGAMVRLRWRASLPWSLFVAAIAAYALFGTTGDAAFLYFNF